MWLIDEACLRRLVAYWAEFTGGEATAVRNILASRYYPYRTHRLSWTIKHMPAMGYKTPGPTGCPMTHRWTAHWIANVECHRTLHGICKGIARGLQIVTWHLMPHPISHGPSIDMWNTASQYISFPLHHRRVGPREITRSRIRIVMGDAVGSV